MSQSRLEDRDSSRRAQENQHRLVAELRSQYDVIICGAGSSGSVVARRLAENADLRVLLIEAGAATMPRRCSTLPMAGQLGSERDWGFQAQPNPHLNGRALSMAMAKVSGAAPAST